MKRLLSRWIMRSQEGGKVLRMGLLGVTAVSTLVTALKGTYLQQYTLHFIGVIAAVSFVFLYVYDQSGVLNQQNVERMDRADNFAGPGMAMGALIRGRQLSALFEALDEDVSPAEARERVHEATLEACREYRNGIDVEHVFEQPAAGAVTTQQAASPPRPATDGGTHDPEEDHG